MQCTRGGDGGGTRDIVAVVVKVKVEAAAAVTQQTTAACKMRLRGHY